MKNFDTISLPETLRTDVLDAYEYPNFSRDALSVNGEEFAADGFRVEVVSAQDYRVPKAREIEVATMVALGDPEEEVWEEFLPYNDHSIYLLAFDKQSQGEAEDIAAMGRIIPYSPTHSNKTLLDLAIIPGWHAEDIREIPTKDAQNRDIKLHDPADVTEAFFKESGSTDLTTVWDIATMAPNFDHVINKKMSAPKSAMSILAGVSEFGIKACKNGELTHVTSFNDPHAYQFFKKIGYPFKDMFGLGPMLYDSFGSQEGMTAQPAWFDVRDYIEKVKSAESSSYLGKIALNLKAAHVI